MGPYLNILYIYKSSRVISRTQHIKRKKKSRKRNQGRKKSIRVAVREEAELLHDRIQENIYFIQFMGKNLMHFSTKNNILNNSLKACNKFKLYSYVKTRKYLIH